MDKMTRRKFLHIGGSMAVGAFVAGAAGTGLWHMFRDPEKLFFDSPAKTDEEAAQLRRSQFVSPYRRVFGFETEGNVTALEVSRGNIVLATSGGIALYGISGQRQSAFPVEGEVRDICVFSDKIFVLLPTRVEVYSLSGERLRQWEACSDESDYCQLTAFEGGVFVTDAGQKNVCQYTLEGNLVRFIQSPQGFVVPSYCFAIANQDGEVLVSNPGRHKVERYTADGKFISSFGEAGTAPGQFSGCCNPARLTATTGGELLTSEKGRPRISCFSPNGQFRSVLLDAKALGGGHEAYLLRVLGDKLVTVAGRKVSVFQYNKAQSQETLCGECDLPCPMKVK